MTAPPVDEHTKPVLLLYFKVSLCVAVCLGYSFSAFLSLSFYFFLFSPDTRVDTLNVLFLVRGRYSISGEMYFFYLFRNFCWPQVAATLDVSGADAELSSTLQLSSVLLFVLLTAFPASSSPWSGQRTCVLLLHECLSKQVGEPCTPCERHCTRLSPQI